MIPLVPFGGPEAALTIHGALRHDPSALSITYTVTGNLTSVVLEPRAPHPERRDNLWQTTCFELFFASPTETTYWELNLSPAGHWNLYRFDDFREGMRQEASVTAVAITTKAAADLFTLTATVPLPPEAAALTHLTAALTVVLAHADGNLSYWAAKHHPDQPDFHDRATWTHRA